VLEDLEQAHPVERTVLEPKRGRVHVCGREPSDPAGTKRAEISSALLVHVDRRHLELGKCVEERPQEGAAAAADIEEARRHEACQHGEDAPDPGKEAVVEPLELVHPEPARKPLPEDLLVIPEDRGRQHVGQTTASERGTEGDVVPVEGGLHGERER
jgi:hypothetical protein